jgi:hypothetical protein
VGWHLQQGATRRQKEGRPAYHAGELAREWPDCSSFFTWIHGSACSCWALPCRISLPSQQLEPADDAPAAPPHAGGGGLAAAAPAAAGSRWMAMGLLVVMKLARDMRSPPAGAAWMGVGESTAVAGLARDAEPGVPLPAAAGFEEEAGAADRQKSQQLMARISGGKEGRADARCSQNLNCKPGQASSSAMKTDSRNKGQGCPLRRPTPTTLLAAYAQQRQWPHTHLLPPPPG